MAEWARVLNTTLRKYLRDVENNVMRNRRLTAMIREKGRVRYNFSGEQVEWRVQFKRVAMTPYADMDVVTHQRQDRWKIANLDWRGYNIADAVSKKERLMNQGEEAIIKLYAAMSERLAEDMEDAFAEELYVDGTTAANAKRIHGVESFLSGTSGSVTVANGFKSPSGTFAGLNVALQYYGGTWTGSWPDGTGDAHYDFWSPIHVDYTDADAWGSGLDTWAENAHVVLRAGIIKAQRNKARKGQMDFIICDDTMYRGLLELLDDKERIIVERGEKSKLVALGFRDVINYDGVDVTWEYGVPANTAYGFNLNMMELRSLQPQLFVPNGPDWDPTTKTWRLDVDFFGNATWNPRHFVKWKNYT